MTNLTTKKLRRSLIATCLFAQVVQAGEKVTFACQKSPDGRVQIIEPDEERELKSLGFKGSYAVDFHLNKFLNTGARDKDGWQDGICLYTITAKRR